MTGLAIAAMVSTLIGMLCFPIALISSVLKHEGAARIIAGVGLIFLAISIILFTARGVSRIHHAAQEKVKQIDTIEYSAKNYRIVEKVVEIENQRDTFYLVIGK